MKKIDVIINRLIEKYQPDAIIVYGSFSDGSENQNSDFDALVIADCEKQHDDSVIENTVLDVFVYPTKTFRDDYDPEEFVQVFDGKIILDKSKTAARLKKRVCDYISGTPEKTNDEIFQEVSWCEKMLSRTIREDAEGYYRWHWLLFDSLEIYFDIKKLHYYGPKKSLRYMAQNDEEAFRIYSLALKNFEREKLSEWVVFLKRMAGIL